MISNFSKLTKFVINFRYAWNPRKPRLIWRLVMNFMHMLTTGNQLLRYVDLQIGNKCNIRCKHCFANYYADDRGRIKPDIFRIAAREAMELGAVNFSFQGGEPTLYKDLDVFIQAAYPDRNVISVTTNGTTITEENCRKWKGYGVDILTVSIDNFRPLEYRDLLDKCLLAVRCGLKVTIGTVVCNSNVSFAGGFLQEMVDFAQQHRIILVLILAAPTGNWEDQEQGVMLSPRQLIYVKELTRKYSYVRLDFDATYIHHACPAGTEVLYITSEGSVQACPFIDRGFGNISHESLKTIRERILASKVLQQNRHICMVGEENGVVLKQMLDEGKAEEVKS